MNIEKFKGFDINIEYEKIVDEYAERCKDLVKKNAKEKQLERTGRYIEGWDTKEEKTRSGAHSMVVWNRTDWQLTHLLENGHRIVNKKGGEGWASAFPHIDPAYRSVKNKFIKAMEKAKIDIKNK